MKKENIKVDVNTGALFFELMFLMFLGLKISGAIDWAWIWIFAPLWVPVVIALCIVGVMFVVLAITAGAESKKNKG